MRVLILTSRTRDIASRVLPVLCARPGIDVVQVIVAHGVSPHRRRGLKRKLAKVARIGVLGAANGVRMRKWYVDRDAEDLHAVCASHGVPLADTPFVNCDTTRQLFRDARADLGLSLGNGYIPKSVYSIPRCGMVNIHMEILPDFQGAQSILWPIYEGRRDTGFTIHQIDRQIDTGDIVYQERYPIEFRATLRETVEASLQVARARIPAAFAEVCENYEALRATATRQTHGRTYTTPSIWQFLRMLRNQRRFYREAAAGKQSRAS